MKNPESATITTVAKINKTNILLIEDGEKRVAIKPICEALGVDPESQRKKILADEILGSVTVLSTATGSDKKEYKMTTIPFKYVFGWLFSINPKNVAPGARENIIRYKMECYDALYDHFTSYAEFVEYRQKEMDAKLELMKQARTEFYTAKGQLKIANDELEEVRKINFDAYKEMKAQLEINFEEGKEVK